MAVAGSEEYASIVSLPASSAARSSVGAPPSVDVAAPSSPTATDEAGGSLLLGAPGSSGSGGSHSQALAPRTPYTAASSMLSVSEAVAPMRDFAFDVAAEVRMGPAATAWAIAVA